MLHAASALSTRLPEALPSAVPGDFELVVIGASLGGLRALEQVLAPLPADFRVPIVVVQHLDAHAPSYLASLLAAQTRLRVREARDGEPLQAGTVHVAVPARHLRVTKDRSCRLGREPRVSGSRPSVDVLFDSAAAAFGARTLGVVLTGRLYDGAAGALAIRAAGGVVLAQDPTSCAAPSMPRAAMRAGAVHLTMPPAALAAAIRCFVEVGGMRALLGIGERVA